MAAADARDGGRAVGTPLDPTGVGHAASRSHFVGHHRRPDSHELKSAWLMMEWHSDNLTLSRV